MQNKLLHKIIKTFLSANNAKSIASCKKPNDRQVKTNKGAT